MDVAHITAFSSAIDHVSIQGLLIWLSHSSWTAYSLTQGFAVFGQGTSHSGVLLSLIAACLCFVDDAHRNQ